MNQEDRAHVAAAAELLAELVACPSVGLPSAADVGVPAGEGALVALLAKRLTAWGAHVEQRDVAPGRPNLVARFEGAAAGPALMLEAHSDTVGVAGMSIEPFRPVIRDGRLYGRGACDTKGSMAAMLLAIRRLLDEDGHPPVPLYFVATCGEESNAIGARRLMEEGLRAAAAIVGEPTGLSIVHLHKGAVRFGITTHGVPAHSSIPSQGVNAISLMRRVLHRIEDELAPRLAGRAHPLVGPPTISVGIIHGGTQTNVVAGACRIDVDRRLLPSERPEKAARELRELLDACRAEDPRFKADMEQTEYYPPLDLEPDSPVVRALGAACEEVIGTATLAGVPWATNGAWFRAAGIPSVVFGPGSIEQAHTRDEWVDLSEVAQAADILARAIRRFARA